MTDEHAQRRFDGRVAVITGAGRGLGRAYAELLAGLGARVVVNDIGAALAGEGTDTSPAEETVAAIREAGGEAVANFDSVATPEGGVAIVASALDTFGRVDVLINNAGNTLFAELADIDYADFRRIVDVHLLGAFHVVQPAFRAMRAAGYGRVVLTGSIGGLYTMPATVPYAISKSAMIGLNNAVAIEGADHGIRSNVILPGALTRMADGLDTSQYPPMGPELVAPAVAWLAHESCTVTGELFAAVAGRIARAFITETEGAYQPAWTIDEVASRIDDIRDERRQWTLHPAEGAFGEHLSRSFAMTANS